jgi:hypothetical protein
VPRLGNPRFDNRGLAKPERNLTAVARDSHVLVTLVTNCHINENCFSRRTGRVEILLPAAQSRPLIISASSAVSYTVFFGVGASFVVALVVSAKTYGLQSDILCQNLILDHPSYCTSHASRTKADLVSDLQLRLPTSDSFRLTTFYLIVS